MGRPKRRKGRPSHLDKIAELLVSLKDDPYRYVMANWPWGEEGAPLEHETGPDAWQKEVLDIIGEGTRKWETRQIAVKSGHSVGKSALITWVINYFMTTRSHPQIIVTANTAAQLATKTWRELAKWHKMALNKDFFEWTATRYSQAQHKEDWFASAIPWSERNSEAFAGAHEDRPHSAVLVIMDEASGIPDVIWEVAAGAMSTPGSLWLAFGNPTQSTGAFRECWGKFRHRWHGVTVDARNAKKADQKLINEWIDDYGLDSDFVRVRVLGEFPKQAANQLIASSDVDAAIGNRVEHYKQSTKVMGFDVARYGDDQSVITVRQGRKVIAIEKRRGLDTMQSVGFCLEMINKHHPDVTYIDEGGLGAGVVDRLKEQNIRGCVGINFGSSADDPKNYKNKRCEMWGRMKEWLHSGNCDIPNDSELRSDLVAPMYWYTSDEKLIIEKKADMKRRGLASPDAADSLALTFSQPYDKIARFGSTVNTVARMRRNKKKRRQMMSSSPAGY